MGVDKFGKHKLISLVIVLLIVLLAIGAAITFYATAPTEKQKIIKIGAILPLSGSTAFVGQDLQEGIDLAVLDINNDGGIAGRKLEIVYEDSRGNAKEGVTSYQKLRAQEDVKFFITTLSDVTLSIAPLAEGGMEFPLRWAACYLVHLGACGPKAAPQPSPMQSV